MLEKKRAAATEQLTPLERLLPPPDEESDSCTESGELNGGSKATLQQRNPSVAPREPPPSTSRLQSNVVQSQCCTHSGLSCCLEINLALAPLYIPVILSIEVHPVLRPFAVQHIKCKPIPTDASDLRRIYLTENRLNMGELNKAKCNLFGHFPT